MANFMIAYNITMKHEGIYSNNPRDVGGETFRGISRKFHPEWKGWKIIDEAKKSGMSFPDILQPPEYMILHDELVPQFYKENYWNVFLGDIIRNDFQIICNELFDTGVNMGIQRAVLFLQKSLNTIGQCKSVVTTTPLIEDGLFGNKTFNALDRMNPKHIPTLYKMMNIIQGNHYLRYIEKDFRQAEFLVGWLQRVDITKV